MNELSISCELYGVTHDLRVTAINFARKPELITVSSTDVERMLNGIQVGVAYETYSVYRHLKAGNADFKIRKIERTEGNIWRYTFEDRRHRMFETYLVRRR